jgi:TolB-like protein
MDRRPTIAVRPFQLIGADPVRQAIAEAIPSEIIATLSRLGWINVIARGSSFRFGADAADDADMASQLRATYLVSGGVEFMGKALALYVQLTDTRTQHVVWSDRRTGPFDDVYQMRAALTRDLSNALELGISHHEAERLALVSSEDLDAWGHYHLGIRHMYRYNAADNQIAAQHFQRAVDIDPDFSRAHGGLSYTEFQNAFQYFGTDTQHHINMTQRHAERAVNRGEADPFCNLIYGRARWLADDAEGGLVWIDRALRLNPNYALGYYNNANLNTVLCNDAAAEEASEKALFLSPMDPQLQSMYGTRALAALIAGKLDAARRYSGHALNAPRPHLYVYIIAAVVFHRTGDMARAEDCVAKIHDRNARFGKVEFLTYFNLRDPAQHRAVFDALADLGI